MTSEAYKDATILLVEPDVVVRFALSDFLRHCGHRVIEAADGAEAKAVLTVGPRIDVMICEAQLAHGQNGFALAQWVRRYRNHIEVLLTSTVSNKALVVTEFCGRHPGTPSPSDAATLAGRIQTMLAERKRRMRPAATANRYVRRKIFS